MESQQQSPRIELLQEKMMVGMRQQMSFAENTTPQLWQRFMPRRKVIEHAVGAELYSLEVYPANFFDSYDPTAMFDKRAAVEVSSYNNIREGMEALVVPAGLYAMFLHRDPASESHNTYTYIFTELLPQSAYVPDDRPHLAVIGEKYKHEDPTSEEEICIPVKIGNELMQ
jgi:AraC family transcriptional regulator